jgi:hypothetical protein
MMIDQYGGLVMGDSYLEKSLPQCPIFTPSSPCIVLEIGILHVVL